MASSADASAPLSPADRRVTVRPSRSVAAAGRTALGALVRRDLRVLGKNFGQFVGWRACWRPGWRAGSGRRPAVSAGWTCCSACASWP